MELWIRSQNKSILMKVDSLLIDDKKHYIYTHNYINHIQLTYVLGEYSTRKRALEVLDEIQKRLTSCWVVNGFGEYKDQANVIIYEMPKD